MVEAASQLHGSTDGDMTPSASRGSAEPSVVLLVDDDPSVLSIVGRYITRCGCRVPSADSPHGALEIASATERVDLLVTDVRMPRMTGPELYRRLVAQRPGLGVVYISGYPGDILRDHGIAAGEALFLEKPFTAAEMAAKIREALSGALRPVLAPA